MKKVLMSLVAILVVLLVLFFIVLPSVVANRANRVIARPAFAPRAEAVQLQTKLSITDLHCDALLWNRDLLQHGTAGHVDVPRLIAGNVALQAFTIVSKVPLGLNIERNTGKWDMIGLLAVAQRWPVRTWGSLKERALYQCRKLHEVAWRSDGKFVIIETAGDLESYLARRQHEPGITAGFLGVEGAQVLEGDVANVDILFDAGVRMMAPTHFFDTEVGGSAHGVDKGGLTDLGREMIRRMEAKHMLLDLAHASSQTIDEALTMVTRPVVVSHTGVKATCDNTRNLSDAQIRGVAQTGGVIGIGYWDTAVCGSDAKAIVKAIRHVVDLVGVTHVALGSDFDGAVAEPFDTTGLIEITDTLLAEGFSESDIELIMGGNALRLLRENLP